MPVDSQALAQALGMTPPPSVSLSAPDPQPPQFPQGLQNNQQAIQQNSALSSAITAGMQQPVQPQPQQDPHPIRSYLSNWLHNIGEAAKVQAGLPTEAETQAQNYKNQLMQSQTALVNKQAGNLDTVPFDLGNGQMIQVPKNAVGALAGKITTSQNNLEGKYAGISAQLNKMGMRLNSDNQPEVIPQNELSPLQRSQLETSQATTGLKNAQTELASAKAAGIPEQIAIAQKKVAAYQQIANAASLNANTGVGKLSLANQEFQAKYGVTKNPDGTIQTGSNFALLNPHAQQVLMETNPRIDQMNELLAKLEPKKDDDSPAPYLTDRLAYAAGHAGPDNVAQQIADLELGKIQTSAALAKGNSRNYQFIQDIYKHQPNLYLDSNKLLYEKLTNIRDNMQRIADGAVKYGNKQGITPVGNTPPSTTPNAVPPTQGWFHSQGINSGVRR